MIANGRDWIRERNTARESNPAKAPAPKVVRGNRTHCAGLPRDNHVAACEEYLRIAEPHRLANAPAVGMKRPDLHGKC